MGDDDHAVRLARRLPLSREDLDAFDAFEASLSHLVVHRRFLEVWGGCRHNAPRRVIVLWDSGSK
jgi:hypothetical protein